VLEYTPDESIEPDLAARIFEQVLMEQPRKLRPDYVSCTDDYVEYGIGQPGSGLVVGGDSGVLGFGSGGEQYVERIYFGSIGRTRLSRGRGWFFVKVWDERDRRIGSYRVGTEEKAERLVDAFASMQARAPSLFSD